MNKTVMIVDDEAFIRQSFADWFEDHQWRPLEAASGEQALELLEGEAPDGAVVDIRMSGMTGDELIRRASRKRPDMVFVICTGSPEYRIPADLLASPCVCDRVFTKPVTGFSDLEAVLLQLIAEMKAKRD